MSLYRNIIVDVPTEAQVVSSTGRVYVIREKRYDKEAQYNNDKRITIGWLNDTSGKTMNPNTNYTVRYPGEFERASFGKAAPITKRIGLYVCTLACGVSTGLYDVLVRCCGPEHANRIMDYAMYSMLYKTNVARDFELMMRDQLLFSGEPRSDSWISDFFSKQISGDEIERFKTEWAHVCQKNVKRKVWLCIDGSNSDCASEEVEYAEKGKAKSRRNTNIYSYMYAVDAADGTPITYQLYRGGRVDSKALSEMAECLRAYDIEVEGVILDRGFCDIECFRLILDSGYRYIMMMKENTYGFASQLSRHGKELANNIYYYAAPGIFALTDRGRIFQKFAHEPYITLVYDAVNGSERVRHLTGKVFSEIDKAIEAVERGKKPSINVRLKKYIRASTSPPFFKVNEEELQKEIDTKGFSAIAASDDFGAVEVLRKYDMRDASEKQYMILKTQLGYHVARSHQTAGVRSRHFAAFVAGIIRNEIKKHCKSLEYELTKAIREMNFLAIQRMPDQTYMAVRNANSRQIALLDRLGLWESDLDYFAIQETERISGTSISQVAHMPPPHEGEKRQEKKRGRGRPKGSTKKKAEEEPKEKQKPGRPKGATNRQKQGEEMSGIRRGPGRPKGSKNKKGAVNAKLKRAEQKELNYKERNSSSDSI